MGKTIKLSGMVCQSKGTKIKEKESGQEVTFNIFLKNENGLQINVHTEDIKLHDRFKVGMDYTITAKTPQTTISG